MGSLGRFCPPTHISGLTPTESTLTRSAKLTPLKYALAKKYPGVGYISFSQSASHAEARKLHSRRLRGARTLHRKNACRESCGRHAQVLQNQHLHKNGGGGYPLFRRRGFWFSRSRGALVWNPGVLKHAGFSAHGVGCGAPHPKKTARWGHDQDSSNVSSTISGFVRSRRGGPQVPAPHEVKTSIWPKRWRPCT